MMQRRRLASLLAGLLFGIVGARADEIDDFIGPSMERLHIPGLSLAIVKDGAIVKSQGYGVADRENALIARADSVFKIGSASKQFIATGVMLLVQENKLGLNDSVARYIQGSPAAWQPITIRHLLTHTSGLVREAPGFDPYKIQPDIAVIESAYPLPLQFKPGDKYEYSNLGYFVLAEVIHQVSGQPWTKFLHERIFAPLEMNDTRETGVSAVIPRRAHGYAWRSDRFENTADWPAVRPSGAFVSTTLDLAKWEAALLTNRILTTASKEQMWTWVRLNDGGTFPYGFGWQLNDWPADAPGRTGVPMIRHGGSIPGFRAMYARWPSYGLAIVVLTNLEDAPLDGVVAGIAIRVVPELKTVGSR